MGSRRKGREAALRILYFMDVSSVSGTQAIKSYWGHLTGDDEPSEGAEFVRMGSLRGDKIRLLSSRDRQSAVHWYQDGRFHGTSRPGQSLFLDLDIGAHELSCMTESGESAAVRFQVLAPTHN